MTLSTLALKHMARDVQNVVYRVDIGDDPGVGPIIAPNHIASFLYGHEWPVFTFAVPIPLRVVSISGMSQELAPHTGETSAGAMSVVLEDCDDVRELVANNHILGKQLIVERGYNDPNWAYTDWIPYWRGTIDSHEFKDGGLTITGIHLSSDATKTLGGAQKLRESVPTATSASISVESDCDITAFQSIATPLTTIEDLLALAQWPSDYIDSTSLDPSTAANDYISHLRSSLCVTDMADRRIQSTTEIWPLCQRIAFLLRGMLYFAETGKVTFKRINPSAAVEASWDDDQILGVEMSTISTIDDITCALDCRTANMGDEMQPYALDNPRTGDSYQILINTADATQQGVWGHDQSAANPLSHLIEIYDDVFGAAGAAYISSVTDDPLRITPAITPINSSFEPINTVLDVNADGEWDWPGLGSTADTVSADRPIYLALVKDDGTLAIVKYEGITKYAAIDEYLEVDTPTFVDGDNTITGEMYVFDITAVYLLAVQILEMYGDSAAQIKLSTVTDPGTWDVQIGDLVSLETTEYVDVDTTGSASGYKFIVLSKVHDPETDRIDWILQKIASGSFSPDFAAVTPSFIGGRGSGRFNLGDGLRIPDLTDFGDDSGTEAAVLDGMLGSTSGTLAHTIPAGVAIIGGGQVETPEYAHTYTASKDTWVFISPLGGRAPMPRWHYSEVSNGAPRPSDPATNAVPIMRVRTDGGAITDVVDLRNRGFASSAALAEVEKVSTYGGENLSSAVVDGLDFSYTGGTVVATMDKGSALVGGQRIRREQDEDRTYTKLMRTFVDVDQTGTLYYTEAALAAAEPIMTVAGYTRIGVVTTDASQITTARRYPQQRSTSSRAMQPGAIRDAQIPNGNLDDLNVATRMPYGWTKSQGSGATIQADTDPRLGRYVIDCELTSIAADSYIYSDRFELAPEGRYHMVVVYDTDGSTQRPTVSIGLQYYNEYMASLGTRYFVLSGTTIADEANPEGGRLTGVLRGAGSDDDQIPTTARYARVVVKLEANGAGTSLVSFSSFQMDKTPGAGSVLLDAFLDATAPSGSPVSVAAPTWTDATSQDVDVPYLSTETGKTVKVVAMAMFSWSGSQVNDTIQFRIYDSTNAVASTASPINKVRNNATDGREGVCTFHHVFDVPDGTTATIKGQFQRASGGGTVYVDTCDLVCMVQRNADDS